MYHFINSIIQNGIIGFFTGFFGIFVGGVVSFFIKDRGTRIKGSVLGFLGGVTLGIVFFDLFPEAIAFGNIYISISGAVLGLTLAVILDGKLDNLGKAEIEGKYNNYFKAAIFMAIGISIHNLPSGLALGSLLYNSPQNGFYLAIVLVLDGIPEGLTIGMLLRESKESITKLLFLSIMLAIPLGIGSLLGGILRTASILCLSLSIAAAMILYVTLKETLPAANNLWRGRLTIIGNVLGIILGMLFLSLL